MSDDGKDIKRTTAPSKTLKRSDESDDTEVAIGNIGTK